VIVLHGLGGGGDQMALYTGFDLYAQRDHFRAVYPDGIDHAWNAAFCCPFGAPAQHDDVGFLVALADRLGKPGWPVFVTGFSNGGMMAYRMACDVPQRLVAIAVVATDSEECAPSGTLPAILHIQGTADPLTGNRVWGIRDGHWVNTEPSATDRWQKLGARVRLVSVAGGGHVWYHAAPDASAEVAEFLARSYSSSAR
jgi:poly(3-hydroxybutyrate) depolymerase